MNKRDLDFILAYAEVYAMMERPFSEVYKEITEFFNDALESTDGEFSVEGYKDDFLMSYNAMKEYHLEDDIQREMLSGESFFSACREWDI